MLQYLHLDVCLLPSPYRAFMIKLLLPFFTIVDTVCYEIHPNFRHSVVINHVICCSFPSMRNIFDCCSEFCSNSSSWLALCNILLCFFRHPSMLQADPQLHSATLQPATKTKLVNFYSLSPLLFIYIFKYVTLWSFFGNLISCS